MIDQKALELGVYYWISRLGNGAAEPGVAEISQKCVIVRLSDGIGLVQSFVLAVGGGNGGKWQVATSYTSAVNVPAEGVQLD